MSYEQKHLKPESAKLLTPNLTARKLYLEVVELLELCREAALQPAGRVLPQSKGLTRAWAGLPR